MLKPMRSFTLLAGLKNSSLAATCAWQPSVTRFKKTRGVLPISSVTSRAIFMANLLGGNAGAKSSSHVDIVLRIWAFEEASDTVALSPALHDVLDAKNRHRSQNLCLALYFRLKPLVLLRGWRGRCGRIRRHVFVVLYYFVQMDRTRNRRHFRDLAALSVGDVNAEVGQGVAGNAVEFHTRFFVGCHGSDQIRR